MSFKVDKEVEQKLRYIESRLPVVFDNAHEDRYLTKEELLRDFPDTDFSKVKPVQKGAMKGKYLTTYPVQVASNHYRRMRKLYAQNGEQAVIDYIKQIQELCQKNSKPSLQPPSRELTLTGLLANLWKRMIKLFSISTNSN